MRGAKLRDSVRRWLGMEQMDQQMRALTTHCAQVIAEQQDRATALAADVAMLKSARSTTTPTAIAEPYDAHMGRL